MKVGRTPSLQIIMRVEQDHPCIGVGTAPGTYKCSINASYSWLLLFALILLTPNYVVINLASQVP